jgi:hypothetical protein
MRANRQLECIPIARLTHGPAAVRSRDRRNIAGADRTADRTGSRSAEAGPAWKPRAARCNLLKCNIYGTSAKHFATVNAIYARYFPDEPPARIFVCVPEWTGPFDIEIDCVAWRRSPRAPWVVASSCELLLALICPSGLRRRGLSSPFCKNILLFRKRKSVYIQPRLVPQEGRLAIVTDAGRDAVDVDVSLTNDADADGEDVWS